MDPNELLAKLRQAVDAGRKFAEGVQTHPDGMTENEEALSGTVVELTSHFWALDTWLSRGGFAPHAWRLLDVQWRDHDLGPDEARSIPEPLGPPNPAHGHLPEHHDDDPCPCGASHTRSEHGYDPDKPRRMTDAEAAAEIVEHGFAHDGSTDHGGA